MLCEKDLRDVTHGNQGKHRVTKRGPALSYPMFTLVTSENIAESRAVGLISESKLGTFDKETLVNPFLVKLKKTLDEFEKDIINGKRNKFYRDKMDFGKDQAFKDIEDLRLNSSKYNNLSAGERRALKELCNNTEFLVREADKGGNVVLWPHEMYSIEVLRQLNNTNNYHVLPSDPTWVFKGKLDHLIKEATGEGILNKREADFLVTHHPVVPTFYILPKVHKSLNRPPGRPIVSGIGGIMERPCIYLDHFLQPMALSRLLYKGLSTFDDTSGRSDGSRGYPVDFLDIKLTLEGNRVSSCLYRKSTATNNLLHYSSFHPVHLKNGIPKGQFLRLHRNCSSSDDFLRLAGDLTTRFISRQYPRKIVSRGFQAAKQRDRLSLFGRQERESVQPLSLITIYNNQWSDVYRILNKNWNILLSEPKLVSHITPSPKIVARRATNLKDQLCHSHYQRPKSKLRTGQRIRGTFPCGGCNVCQFMIAQEEISIDVLSSPLKCNFYFKCRSTNHVYVLLCDCPKLYVGQTSQQLRRRCQQHISNINMARRDLSRGRN
ncbi:unnamed protein product [Ranitomeya imitator]|uniref:GIY-YIG domain-containing protein n=1 Tax=Ranitomeya imitator TaxID=111125 RepID=A0ABN9KX22_9NEOB|nr:unnamed protein product [Ranitomeya imitator]